MSSPPQFTTMATSSLQIKVKIPQNSSSNTTLLGGGSSEATVGRSRSMRGSTNPYQRRYQEKIEDASLRLPPHSRPSRSLSPRPMRNEGGGVRRSHSPCLPTRSPTPPRGGGSKPPPSSPNLQTRKVHLIRQGYKTVNDSHSCPSTPLMLRATAPRLLISREKSTTEIVKPRRASGLSRSPSPSPSTRSPSPRRRRSSLKVAERLTSNLKLSNLTPPQQRKYGTASMASYDRSDGEARQKMAPPARSPRTMRKLGTALQNLPGYSGLSAYKCIILL